MASKELGDFWQQAGEALGFTVEAPYLAHVPGGPPIEFAARLPDFGAPRGMLLSDSYAAFSASTNELVAAGYGYSVMRPPCGTEDLASVVEVLQDWGWTASAPIPKWLGGEA